ncbi:MAG: phytanoyl-CoA dioxygenase family protein [Mycobacteriales bacterium]
MNAPSITDTAYTVGRPAVEEFDGLGFTRIRRVFDAPALRDLTAEIEARLQGAPTHDGGVPGSYLCVPNVWRHGEVAARFVLSRRLGRIAADLLGVRSVRILYDVAMMRRPGDGAVPWHVDQARFPFSSDRVVTLCLHLHDVLPECGPISFAAGSHRLGREWLAAPADRIDPSSYGIEEISTEQFASGDASLHLGWTLHGAQVNRSDRPVLTLGIVYIDGDIEVADPVSEAQARELRRWMPGAQVGRVPDTPMNPVVYRAPIAI